MSDVEATSGALLRFIGAIIRKNTALIEWTDNVNIVGVRTLFNILNFR